MLSSLGSPDGDDGVKDTSPPAVDETSEDHPGVVHGRGLESSTEDSPGSTESDCLNTSILVAEPAADQAAYQSADVVDGDYASLEQRVVNDRSPCLRVWMAEVHGFVVVILGAIDATHHTLVITEEEDGKRSDAVDGY